MKIKTKVKNLKEAINDCSIAIAKLTTIPALTRVCLQEKNGALIAMGNNGNQGVVTQVADTEVTNGNGKKITVDPTVIVPVLNSSKEDASVTLTVEEDRISVKIDRMKLELPRFTDDEEYPEPEMLSGYEGKKKLVINTNSIKQVLHSSGENPNNKMMETICIKVGEKATYVALDGHRISVRGADFEPQLAHVLVPLESGNMLLKLFGEEELIAFTEEKTSLNQKIWFVNEKVIFVTNTQSGEFFDISKIFTRKEVENAAIKVQADRETLIRELKPFLTIKKDVIRLDINKEGVVVASIANDSNVRLTSSLTVEEVQCQTPTKLGLNPEFVMQSLNSIESESVCFYIGGANMPVNIMGEEYSECILPVKIEA